MSIETDILSTVNDRYTVKGFQWERRRRELLGFGLHRREQVARELGVSVRTIERYETGRAPKWYALALEGLSARRKQKA